MLNFILRRQERFHPNHSESCSLKQSSTVLQSDKSSWWREAVFLEGFLLPEFNITHLSCRINPLLSLCTSNFLLTVVCRHLKESEAGNCYKIWDIILIAGLLLWWQGKGHNQLIKVWNLLTVLWDDKHLFRKALFFMVPLFHSPV